MGEMGEKNNSSTFVMLSTDNLKRKLYHTVLISKVFCSLVYIYYSIKAIGCQWVSLFVCLFTYCFRFGWNLNEIFPMDFRRFLTMDRKCRSAETANAPTHFVVAIQSEKIVTVLIQQLLSPQKKVARWTFHWKKLIHSII